MSRFLRTDVGGRGHSRLSPPTVVIGGKVDPFAPIRVYFAADVSDGIYHRNNQRQPYSRLRPPAVIAPVLARPVQVNLAPSFRGISMSRIAPPTVVSSFFVARPVQVNFAVDTLRRSYRVVSRIPKSRLSPPIVVGAGIAFHGPGVRLTDPLSPNFLNRRQAKSRLGTPIVGEPPVALAPPVAVTLALSSRGTPKSRLLKPIVVFAFAAPPLKTTLTRIRPARTRWLLRRPADLVDREDLGFVSVALVQIRPVATSYRLVPPSVIDLRPQTYYLTTYLAPSFRGTPKSRLSLPVVAAIVAFVATPVEVRLARSTRGVPLSGLGRPIVIRAADRVYPQGPMVQYVRIRPVAVRSRLGQLQDLADRRADLGSVRVHLSYSVRGVPKSRLFAPKVVFPRILGRPTDVTLVRIRPIPTRWLLRKPSDLVDQQDLGFVRTHLAPSSRGISKSKLSKPTVIFPFFARQTDITLVRIRPAQTRRLLRKPVDLVDREDVGFVRIHLAYSLRGVPKSRLRTPVVIDTRPQAFYLATWLAYSKRGAPKSRLGLPSKFAPIPKAERVLQTTFAYQSRGKTKSRLKPPAVVGAGRYFRGILVNLAPSKRGKPKSRLLTVPAAFRPVGRILVELAPSRLPKPKSVLRKPIVVAPVLARRALSVFAAQRRGKPKSILRNPTRVAPVLARTVEVSVVRIRPARTMWRLAPPKVVTARAPADAVADITLAYQSRGKPKSRLFPPKVVAPVLARPVDVWLARQSRGAAKSRLRLVVYAARSVAPIRVFLAPSTRIGRTPNIRLQGPTRVSPVLARPIRVELAPSRRPTVHSTLKLPAVLSVPVVHEAVVRFAKIRPAGTMWLLRSPAVVGGSITFPGTKVTLVRIRPVPTAHWYVRGLIGAVCYGTVTGFDFAPSVCGFDEGPVAVGTDTTDHAVSGSDVGATVTGTSAAGATVTGGDTKREGC